jgi:hypothetical protein
MAIDPSRIAVYTDNPRVQRYVRIIGTLTSVAPTVTIGYNTLGVQDQLDYGTSALRYNTIKCLRARVWLDSPAAISTQPAFGLFLRDAASLVEFTDRPVGTNTCAAAAMHLCLETINGDAPIASTAPIVTVGCDSVIPVGYLLRFVCDVFCDFK